MATRHTPPFLFFFLNVCIGWPVGVVAGALGNALVRSGFTVGQTASIIAAAGMPFTLQVVWATIIDSSGTRRRWFVGGAALMCIGLAALLAAPWRPAFAGVFAALAFLSCLGAAVGAAASKGLIAHHVRPDRVGSASAWYMSGGGFSHAVAGAATLALLTHVTSRPLVALISAGAVALAATAVLFISPEAPVQAREVPAKLGAAIGETWGLIRSPAGVLAALMCLVPFGTGGAAGLFGSVASQWSVDPDLLAALIGFGAIGGVVGPLAAGWLSVRFGAWRTYMVLGWILIIIAVVLAFLPPRPINFAALELLYRAVARAGSAALLAIVMTTIGKGAASTKASALWSLANLSTVYMELTLGTVHDRAHRASAMLLADAGLSVVGFLVIVVVARALRIGLDRPRAPNAAAA